MTDNDCDDGIVMSFVSVFAVAGFLACAFSRKRHASGAGAAVCALLSTWAALAHHVLVMGGSVWAIAWLWPPLLLMAPRGAAWRERCVVV